MQATIDVNGVSRQVFGSDDDGYFQTWARAGAYGGPRDLVPFRQCVRPDSVCVDIGANLGLTALLMSELAPDGHVWAFEPEPANFAYLVQTLKVNAIDNCTAIRAAVGSKSSRVRLLAAGPHSHITPTDADGTLDVEVVALDGWARATALDRLDFVKIDVEGHEHEVLTGARETIARYRPCALIEFNSLTTITVGRQLPHVLLDQIMDLFPRVAVVDRETGVPRPLGRSRDARDLFVAENLMTGFLDDLACSFG